MSQSSPARAGEVDAAVLEHVAAVGDAQRQRDLLLGDDDGEAVAAQVAEGGVGIGRQLRRQPGGRLVEHEQARLAHQRPADREHLLLASAHRRRPLPLPFSEAGEQGEDEVAPGRVRASRVGAEVEVFVDGHLREQVPLGRDVGEAESGDAMRPPSRDGVAVEAHRAA